jgi:hypothetical protein
MLSLKSRSTCISYRVPTQPQPRTSIIPTLIPSTQTDCDGIIDYCDQTSSLFRLSPGATVPGPSTTVNDHPVSGIGNGGSTAEEFVFDPEIAGCIHAMWQDPAIPQMLDHSLVLVPRLVGVHIYITLSTTGMVECSGDIFPLFYWALFVRCAFEFPFGLSLWLWTFRLNLFRL